MPLVYVGACFDLLHHGHIRLLKTAAQYGVVVVGLLTDDAMQSYKRAPILSYKHRQEIVESLKYVHRVMPQHTLDYTTNLLSLRPQYVVHGSDWKTGTQQMIRNKCIQVLHTWGGQLIEPPYTEDVSTTDLIMLIQRR